MHGDGLFLKDSFWRKQGLIPHHILPPHLCPPPAPLQQVLPVQGHCPQAVWVLASRCPLWGWKGQSHFSGLLYKPWPQRQELVQVLLIPRERARIAHGVVCRSVGVKCTGSQLRPPQIPGERRRTEKEMGWKEG